MISPPFTNLSLVFDLDGTLIDSIPQVVAAVNATLVDASRRALPQVAVREMIGEGVRVTIEQAFAATGGVKGVNINAMIERYLAHYLADTASHIAIFPGVVEVLEQFRAAGAIMGICTNKPGATTRPVLDALGLSRFFAAVVTADDTCYRKPDGRHVLDTIAAMNAESAQAIFVGDSETDLAAADDAGVPAILVAYGYGGAAVKTMPTAGRIDRFHDLPAAVAEIISRKVG